MRTVAIGLELRASMWMDYQKQVVDCSVRYDTVYVMCENRKQHHMLFMGT